MQCFSRRNATCYQTENMHFSQYRTALKKINGVSSTDHLTFVITTIFFVAKIMPKPQYRE